MILTVCNLKSAKLAGFASAGMVLCAKKDGKPVGLGKHEDLIATCPTYAEIVDSQHAVAVA